MKTRDTDREQSRRKQGGTVFGVLLIAIGSYAWIADVGTYEILRLWPLLLIAVGISKLIADRYHRDGALMLGVGILFLLDNLDVLSVWNSWPLLLIVAGALNVATAFGYRCGRASPRERKNA